MNIKKIAKITLPAVAVLSVAALLIASSAAPLEVEATTLQSADAEVIYTEQGSCVYRSSIRVTSPLDGEIEEICVTEGQRVKAGDVIAVISATDVQYQIQRLEKEIEGYNAQSYNLTLSSQKDNDELSGLRNDLLEQKSLIDSQSRASEQKLVELRQETVEEGYYDERQDSIDAQLERIDGQMGKNYNSGMQTYYQAQAAAARLNIEQLREKQGKATITAGYDGIVSSLAVKELGAVSQNTELATVGLEPVVEVFVPVREIDGIAPGNVVSLTVSKRQGDMTCTGKVAEIGAQAEIMLSPLGVEESRVRVLVTVDDSALAAGYQADVHFTVYRRPGCIILPRKAVFAQDGQDYVWRVAEGLLTQHPVTTGTEVTGGYIVEEGLQDGDSIIADANIQGLAEGKKVTIL